MKIKVNKKEVGQRILEVRSKMKLTLEDFGKLFNAEKSNISKWERGLSLPNRVRLEKIAKLGDMTVNELLYGSVEYKCICKTWRPTTEYIDYIMKN